MQIGKVSVGGRRDMPFGIPMSQQDKDKLRERRNLALQKFKKLGVANLVLSLLTIGVGVGILVVSGHGSAGWPVFNFGPLVVGIIMLITGLLALMASIKGEGCQRAEPEETPTAVKGLFIGVYILSVTCISICGVSGAFAFLSMGICISGEGELAINCYPDKDTNIALAAIGGILCALLGFSCIIGCIFFCMYARAFGFKNRYERAMEYQMGLMMRAMHENQGGQFQGQPYGGQQRHYQGQPYEGQQRQNRDQQSQPPPDYWGQSGTPQGLFSNPEYSTKY